MRKAFTTIELVVAVSLLAVVMVISGMVFKVAIDAQRQAGAIAEITRNFRAITDQINRDFQGLVKDGFLVLRSEEKTGISVRETDSTTVDVRIDGLYYLSTGDFQSQSSANKSNVSLIYLGLYKDAMNGTSPYCSKWILARRVIKLIPGASNPTNFNDDYSNKSLAEYIANANTIITTTLKSNLTTGFDVDSWQYFSGGVGSFKIEWVIPSFDSSDQLAWIGLDSNIDDPNNNVNDPNGYKWHSHEQQAGSIYTARWEPGSKNYLPRAIKFTMTLYDSRGVIKEGKTFTHIVYIGE